MSKRRGHKALYEVLGSSKLKPGYQKTLEQVKEPEKPQPPPPPPEPEPTQLEDTPKAMTGWPKKPKILQFNESRIELSMPYPLAITALMVVVLLVLVSFRLGQIAMTGQNIASDTNVSDQAAVGRFTPPVEQQALTQPPVLEPPKPTTAAASTGQNRIVIQQYHLRSHLEPVKDYFSEKGIETEILNVNNTYFLVTANKYENPNRTGTDGYETKQRIIELGAAYTAPEGYESFGTQPFHDAYGRKFDE
jgi:hypothetical protein